VNVPTRGIGDTTVERVRTHARAAGLSLVEAARDAVAGAPIGLGPAALRKLEGFLDLLEGLRAILAAGGPVAQLVGQVIERTEYRVRLELDGSPDARDRLRNLAELVAAAAAYDADEGEGATLSGFNERIALTGTADERDGRGECVTLMTVHAAKGLEFPVVFLAGLEEGVFPSLREGDRDEDLEEERRLAYVALTRARDRAILSYATLRRSYDAVRRNEPSRFLADIPAELLAVRARRRSIPRLAPAMAGRPQPEYPSVPDDEPVYYLDEDGDDDPVFPRGALVRHKIYGVGQIQDGSGRGPDRKLSIDFPGHGRKTIVARFVERVSS